MKQGSESMSTITEPKLVVCHVKDYGCAESWRTCPFKVIHMPEEPLSAVGRKEIADMCLYTICVLSDEDLDVSIRRWAEDHFIKRKFPPAPPELFELLDRKATEFSEDYLPDRHFYFGMPFPVIIDEGGLDAETKNVIRDIGE